MYCFLSLSSNGFLTTPHLTSVLNKLIQLKHTLFFVSEQHESERFKLTHQIATALDEVIPDAQVLMRGDGNMLTPVQHKREVVMAALSGLNREQGVLFFENDPACFEMLAEIGIVLKTPGCWDALFPEAVNDAHTEGQFS